MNAARRRTALTWTAAPSLAMLGVLLAACQPTVRVEAPDKPIVINLNIKIEQEVRIKVERDVETLLERNAELF
ncbi:MAG: YnbE family lipoprotein [Rhodospirillaceae bacterium]